MQYMLEALLNADCAFGFYQFFAKNDDSASLKLQENFPKMKQASKYTKIPSHLLQ